MVALENNLFVAMKSHFKLGYVYFIHSTKEVRYWGKYLRFTPVLKLESLGKRYPQDITRLLCRCQNYFNN